MKPPVIARALLLAVAGEAWAECVAGDLEEEFRQVCQARDRAAGARWYVWQVVRSVAPLLGLRMRSGELRQTMLAALVGVAVPLLLLDRLWCFVYSQIPLKDGIGRAPEFLAVNVLSVCVGAAIVGCTRKSRQAIVATALATAAAAGFAMWASAGAAPAQYSGLVLLVAPASSLIAFVRRRS
jgi:hypothetical protein